VVPADDVQASAAARWTRRLGARTVFVLGDKSLEGDGLAEMYRAAAGRSGLRVAGQERMDPRDEDYADLTRELARTRPDAIYFGGGADSNSVQLWRDLHDAVPGALKIGSHNLLVPEFYGRLGAAGTRTYITSIAMDPSQLPARGRRFVRDYRREFGELPDRFAAYGHAAMNLLLDAIGRAGDGAPERDRVIEEAFATTGLDSAVGTFDIDDNGDTSLDRITGYRVRDGRLAVAAALRGTPAD
jgi:branched-chain amino acid transport system substrate-binding protein